MTLADSVYRSIKNRHPKLPVFMTFQANTFHHAPNAQRAAIAETGWRAEDVTAAFPIFIPASDSTQIAYMQRLLADCDELSARFINWFFTRDYDDFWESDLKFSPIASIVHLWKDTELYDGTGNARPALTPWREKLALPRVEP